MSWHHMFRRKPFGPNIVQMRMRRFPRLWMQTHGEADIYISQSLLNHGSWEWRGTAITRDLLRGAHEFVDVGANIGWFTLVASHELRRRGQVHSFEPDPAHLALLRANIAMNWLRNVHVNDCALSDRDGEAVLHLNGTNMGDNSLFPAADRQGTCHVKTMRLDDYSTLSGRGPLLIKLDVQGGEVDVLLGAKQMLSTYPHEIVIRSEFSPAMLEKAGRSAAELAGLLEDAGFQPSLIDPDAGTLTRLTWPELLTQMDRDCARNPDHDADVIAYRQSDGMMSRLRRYIR